MKGVAHGHARHLIDLEVDVGGRRRGQIFDWLNGNLYAPRFLDALASEDDWEWLEFEVDESEAKQRLSQNYAHDELLGLYGDGLLTLDDLIARLVALPRLPQMRSTDPGRAWMEAADMEQMDGPMTLAEIIDIASRRRYLTGDQAAEVKVNLPT